MDAGRYYADNLKPINEAISIICRKHGMSFDEEKDFAQHVHLQLIENEYKKIRAYKGNSSLKTYLYTVISRIFIDQVRVKWHPSAEAKRLGETAVGLEKLVYRKHYTVHEACQILVGKHATTTLDENAAHEILGKLQAKKPPLVRIDDPDDYLPKCPDPAPDPETRLAQKQLYQKRQQIIDIVGGVLSALSDEDKLLIKLLFIDGHRISEIARLLGKADRLLYKVTQSILRKMREAIADAGIAENDIRDVLDLSGECDV